MKPITPIAWRRRAAQKPTSEEVLRPQFPYCGFPPAVLAAKTAPINPPSMDSTWGALE